VGLQVSTFCNYDLYHPG